MEEKIQEIIMNATFLLLENKDMNSISVREIAKQANVNVAAISYYFGGKSGLFSRMMEKLNITLRRSRLSGVARATFPDKQSHLVAT